MQSPYDVLDTETLPNPLADAQLLSGRARCDELVYLSLGETWKPTATGLLEALTQIPEYAHGYTLSPYGLRANGTSLPYQRYDRLSEINHGAIVEHERLSHAFQAAQLLQAKRDNRPASGSLSRANQGTAPNQKKRQAGTKKQREFTTEDLTAAVMHIAAHRSSENTLR